MNKLRIFCLVVGVSTILTACSDEVGSTGSPSGGGAGGGGGAAGNSTGGGNTTTTTTTTGSGAGGAGTGGVGTGGEGNFGPCFEDPPIEEEVVPGTTDPEAGDFTLDEALDGLPPGPGPLRALIETEFGVLTCELRPDVAPKGVANFVGLARGRRPFKDLSVNQWVKRRFYDGLIFHRVIPEFMAQGGDPLGTGYGGPGYKVPDEIGDLTFAPGTLSYANSGPNTNGSQFFVTEIDTPWLEGDFVILGLCDPVAVVTELTHVRTDTNDKPTKDRFIQSIKITRCAP